MCFKTAHSWKPITTEGDPVIYKPSQEHQPDRNSQNTMHFCLGLLFSLPCLRYKAVQRGFSWPGWDLPVTSGRISVLLPIVTLHTRCVILKSSNSTNTPRCSHAAVHAHMSRGTGGSSPQPESSSCRSNQLLCELVCSAGREAGQRKINYVCIAWSRFLLSGSGKRAKLLVT